MLQRHNCYLSKTECICDKCNVLWKEQFTSTLKTFFSSAVEREYNKNTHSTQCFLLNITNKYPECFVTSEFHVLNNESWCFFLLFFSATRLIVGRTTQQNHLILWSIWRRYLLLYSDAFFSSPWIDINCLDKVEIFQLANFPTTGRKSDRHKMAQLHALANFFSMKGK